MAFTRVLQWKRVLCCRNYLNPEQNFIRSCYSNVRITGKLQKLLNKGSKKKWYMSPMSIHPSVSSGKSRFTDGQLRRAEHISHVLYGYITEIVNSGEVSQELAEKSVDIVKVRVLPDFTGANIYWMPSGTKQDEITEQCLHKNEGRIRQLLTSYYVLGRIPHLTFVREKNAFREQQVLELLKTADLGPDPQKDSSEEELGSQETGSCQQQPVDESAPVELPLQDTFTPNAFKTQEDLSVATSSGTEKQAETVAQTESVTCENIDTSSSTIAGRAWQSKLQSRSSVLEENSTAGEDNMSRTPGSPWAQRGTRSVQSDDQWGLKEEDVIKTDVYGVPRARLVEKLLSIKTRSPHVNKSKTTNPVDFNAPQQYLSKDRQNKREKREYSIRDFWNDQ